MSNFHNDEILDGRLKGFPSASDPLRLDQLSQQKWNVLKQDVPFPVAVLRETVMDNNSRWMQSFVERSGVALCPHGKTTMSPQLFQRQMRDGAWGITVATVDQLYICRNAGIQRIVLANQLLDQQSIRYVLDELHRDPDFEFFCLVDSAFGAERLAKSIAEHPLQRPINVLLELGFEGGRTGVRKLSEAMAVASAIHEFSSQLCLSGIECYEGLVTGDQETRAQKVRDMLKELTEIALQCHNQQFFDSESIVLSAGGSAYYDLVVEELTQAQLPFDVQIVLRSGCYLTHDINLYAGFYEEIQQRSSPLLNQAPELRPALEVWAMVQSMPEPGLAIVNLGKRDASHDAGLPKPLKWYSESSGMETLDEKYEVKALNDQHAYLQVPQSTSLQIGDLIGFGISHPCTTFDRWQLIYTVDESYTINSAIRTYF